MSNSTLSITTEQLFSGYAMGYLWSKKESLLDPGSIAQLDAMYKRRTRNLKVCKQSVTYKTSSKSKAGKLGFGRLYGPVGSLEQLPRDIRGTLCKDFYYDLDIANCHPTLLNQLAHHLYDLDLPELDKYIANRDFYLASLCDGERELAKTEIIKVLYNGKSDILKELSKEIKYIAKRLAQDTRYKTLADACKEVDNFYGSFLHYVLVEEEKKVLLCMKSFLESEGWSVDVLAYDGVMIRKTNESLLTQELLRRLEIEITIKTTYEVQIKNKEFEFIEIPEVEEELVPGVKKSDYLDMKRKFEETNFYYHPGHNYAQVRDGDIIFHDTPAHAKQAYFSSYLFKISDKFGDHVPFFDLWNVDPTRKEIHILDYKESNDPTVYTIPLVFEHTKNSSPSEPAPYLKLFHELLSVNTNNNPLLTEYLLNYLAHLVQKPLESPRMALMITGQQGAGKDTLFEFMGRWVLGPKYYEDYDSNEKFFEKHDTGKKGKFLVKLQEADSAFCRKKASDLKAIITSPFLKFNPKGTAMFTLPNYARFILTTNKGNPLELEQGDRRWIIFVASSKYIGNKEFWNQVYNVLFTKEGGKAIADYLQTVDLQNFDPSKKPENAYQDAVIESEKTVEDRFLEDWDGKEIIASELYVLYRDYCINNSLPYCQTSLSLGKRLLPYIASGKLIKKLRREGSFYSK